MDIFQSSSGSPELTELAEYLHDQQDAILEEWRESLKDRENEQVSILDSLSKNKFYNSIPEFLEQLRNNLRGEESPLAHVARRHGAQRWDHGLDLREVVTEWSLLHFVIVNQVYKSQESIPISPNTLAEAQKLITRFVHKGIRASIDEYYRLLRMEADGKVGILERVVREKDELTELRSQNLQETSHDMKGSMTAIRLNLHLLKKTDLSDKARVNQLVKKLSGATDNLHQLLKNLLDLSRLEAGREKLEISEFDAAKLLHGLSDTMMPLADTGNLDLRTRGSDQLIVRGDRLKVHRIAQNLLLNALKYTQKGFVELTWEVPSPDQWQFTIRDTGPGMDLTHFSSRQRTSFDTESHRESSPEEFKEEVPPSSAPTSIQSEGLGLFIVRRLCELLDGVIDIESEEGVGTTVSVRLPADYSRN